MQALGRLNLVVKYFSKMFPTGDHLQSISSQNWRIDVAFFRGLAIILVVLCHLEVPGFKFGFIGVDIFFVISGYVIAGSMLREYEKSYAISKSRARIDLIAFALRRARRILPVAYLGLIFSLIGTYLVAGRIFFEKTLGEILWPALFSANIYFSQQSNDYFASPVDQSIFMHYWSLGVEEQFYIFLPLFFTLLVGVHNLKILRFKLNWIRRLFFGCLIVFTTSILIFVISYEENSSLVYYSLNYRVWELMWGVLCALLSRVVNFKYSWKVELLILTLLPFVMWQASESQVTYPTIFLVLSIGLLFLNNSMRSNPVLRLYKAKPVIFLSRMSFSMYVFHWPVIVLCQNALPSNTWKLLPIEILLILILTFISYFFVEAPILRYPIPHFSIVRLGRSKKRIVKTLSLIVIFSVVYANDPKGINSLISLNFLRPKIEKFDERLTWKNDSSNLSENDSDDVTGIGSTDREGSSMFTESSLQEAMKVAIQNPEKFTQSTFQDLSVRPNLGRLRNCNDKNCQFGFGKTKVALVGDSHMVALGSSLLDVFDLSKYAVLTLLKQGCPVSKLDLVIKPGSPTKKDCEIVDNARVNFLKNNEPEFMIINESYSYPLKLKDSTSIRYAALKEAIELYAPLVKNIIVFTPTPLYASWSKCLSKDLSPANCKGYSSDGAPYFEALARINAEYEQVKVVTINELLCIEGVCPSAVGQLFLTQDGSHFRQEFLQSIKPILKKIFEKVGISAAKP